MPESGKLNKKVSVCVYVCCINAVQKKERERERESVKIPTLAQGLTNVYNKVLRRRFIPSTSPHLIQVQQTPTTHTSRVKIESVPEFVCEA